MFVSGSSGPPPSHAYVPVSPGGCLLTRCNVYLSLGVHATTSSCRLATDKTESSPSEVENNAWGVALRFRLQHPFLRGSDSERAFGWPRVPYQQASMTSGSGLWGGGLRGSCRRDLGGGNLGYEKARAQVLCTLLASVGHTTVPGTDWLWYLEKNGQVPPAGTSLRHGRALRHTRKANRGLQAAYVALECARYTRPAYTDTAALDIRAAIVFNRPTFAPRASRCCCGTRQRL